MTGGKETMKHKYINASELIGMFRDDEMLSCDRPFDVYQWALNIIDECPPADGVVFLDILPGADIWTKDGKHGVVKSYNGGAKGIVRYIAELDGGEKINFPPRELRRTIFPYDPQNPPSERSEDSEGDYASESEND